MTFLDDIDKGVKNLKFRKIYTALIILSFSKGGQTPLPTSIGGGPDSSPLDPPLQAVRQ